MVARRPLVGVLGLGIPVVWRARTWSDPDARRLHFQHVGGATGGMRVTWRIEPTASGCRVSIEHDFRRTLGLPVIGPALGDEAVPRLVDRLFIGPIAGRTLAAFRTIAEAIVADDREAGPPGGMSHDRPPLERERPGRVDHRHRRHHRDRDRASTRSGPGSAPDGRRSGGSIGSTVGVPIAGRRPGRRRSTRSTTWTRRRPASSTGSASSASSPDARRWADAAFTTGGGRSGRSGPHRDLRRQRARRHRLRRGAARALPRPGHPLGQPDPRAGRVRRRGPG